MSDDNVGVAGKRLISTAVALWLGISLAIGLIALVVIIGAGHKSNACRGGKDVFSIPTYYSSDNKHWEATYDCVDGGQTTVNVPASQVPGGS
jgi:hypothetical protein